MQNRKEGKKGIKRLICCVLKRRGGGRLKEKKCERKYSRNKEM